MRQVEFTNEKLDADAELRDGDNFFAETQDGVRIGVEVQDGKIERYVVLSTSSEQQGARVISYLTETSANPGRVRCWVCVEQPGGEMCYEISCDNLPNPK